MLPSFDDHNEGNRLKRSVLISACILGSGLILLAIIYLTEPGAIREGATKETPMLAETTEAQFGDFRPRLTVMGTVRPAEEIVLRPRVEGTIIERSDSFIPGAFVEKGEVLVLIDPDDYHTAVQQRRSELRQAEAALQLERGRQNTAREEFKLIERNLSEEQKSLVLREPQLQDAVAAVESAKAALRLAELQLERTSVAAPFPAQVVERSVNVGSQVAPGDPLARLIGIESYWVEGTVPLSQLDRLTFPEKAGTKGSNVVVRNRTAWPPGAARSGSLYSLIGELENQTRMARVLIEVANPLAHGAAQDTPKLLLGSFVEARIETKKLEGVFRLNRDFVRKNDTVWVMEDSRLSIRNVEVAFRDKEFAYISKGIQRGEQIVTTNLATVVDGASLRTAEEGESTGPGDGPQ